jgi:hypothetical protein
MVVVRDRDRETERLGRLVGFGLGSTDAFLGSLSFSRRTLRTNRAAGTVAMATLPPV